MDDELQFSIIVAIYKVEKYLRQCIDSILQMKYSRYEIILVDDGSPDDCGNICDEYAKRFSIIHVVHQPNMGLSEARNAGLKIAKSKYIIFCDSDDFYLSNTFLLDISEYLNLNPCDVLFFQRRMYIEKKGELIPRPKPYSEELCKERDYGRVLIGLSKSGKMDASACLKVIRRQLIVNKIQFTSGIFSEDVEWIFRLLMMARSARVINLPEYCYRIREGSISHSCTRKNLDDLISTITKYAENIRDSIIDENAKIALLDYLAYQYYIVLGYTDILIDGKNRNEIFLICQKYKWITSYSISIKTKISKILVKTVGIKFAAYIFGLYIGKKYI